MPDPSDPQFPRTASADSTGVPPAQPTLATNGPSAEGQPPQVPGYEVLEELGRGGMGVVYKARQLRPRRLVALKMVLAGAHAGPADRARFSREAEAVAGLQHPGIVQVYEVGEHNGLPFFSLELAEGGTLARRLQAGPMPPAEAARLVEALARAMQAAHERGIVHRDLKPANVLLTADGTPKITDFGLARLAADSEGLTASGAVLGTPGYLAPEQAGQNRTVGPAADVYALGATLFALLTGQAPFAGPTAVDTILQTLTTEPPRPSSLNAKVPRDLDTICLKCLQKSPPSRYPRAADLADDLARCRAGQPIHARPVGVAERAWRWGRRNAVVASLTAVALGLLGVVIALIWPWHGSGADRSLARVKKAGALRVLTDPDCPPMTFREKGELVGFEVDLMKELASRLGVALQVVERRWDYASWVRQLDGHDVDLVVSCVTVTDERGRDVDFVEYVQAPLAFVARKGVSVTRPADLAGKVVAVQNQTTSSQLIDKLRRDGVAFKQVRYCNSTREPFDAVRLGEADVTLDHLPVCRYFARQDARLVVLGAVGHAMSREPLGIALCKRDRALKAAVEEALRAMHEDGTFRAMLDRWFGAD